MILFYIDILLFGSPSAERVVLNPVRRPQVDYEINYYLNNFPVLLNVTIQLGPPGIPILAEGPSTSFESLLTQSILWIMDFLFKRL